MGPSILLDKSALQSLGQDALYEIGRYFYTVVPHVLLMEILADLSLDANDLAASREKVTVMARKILPLHSITNAHYRTMCVHNLLGNFVPMNRKPAIAGAEPVVAKDGSKGLFIDVQPEQDAMLRWRSGQFNEDDLRFAIQWRENAKGTDLEAMKQALPKPPIKIRSATQVGEVVDLMLTVPELQGPLLLWFLGLLRCDSQTCERVIARWKWSVDRTLASFAPYALHCLRVQLIYYTGMIQGFFGTRPSNIVDLEYLYYTPFAFVFCSGDKLHRQLAPFILRDDQSFVDRQVLQKTLNEMAAARVAAPDADPSEDSLIRQLWLKHWKRQPSSAVRETITEEESKRIMESVKPIMDALSQHERQSLNRFPV